MFDKLIKAASNVVNNAVSFIPNVLDEREPEQEPEELVDDNSNNTTVYKSDTTTVNSVTPVAVITPTITAPAPTTTATTVVASATTTLEKPVIDTVQKMCEPATFSYDDQEDLQKRRERIKKFSRIPLTLAVATFISTVQLVFMGPPMCGIEDPNAYDILKTLVMEQVLVVFCLMWYMECAKKHEQSEFANKVVRTTAWDACCHGILWSQGIWLPLFGSYSYWCLENYKAVAVTMFDCGVLLGMQVFYYRSHV